MCQLCVPLEQSMLCNHTLIALSSYMSEQVGLQKQADDQGISRVKDMSGLQSYCSTWHADVA